MNPLTYALLADAAYSKSPTFGTASSAARAVASTTEDGLAIGFPGTNDLACWEADLDVRLVETRQLGVVHRGFWESLQSLWPVLSQQTPVVVYGHSEGAALALLYAAMLCVVGKPPRAVFAFEPPKVSTDFVIGTVLARAGVMLQLYRNGNDLVPLVPVSIRGIAEWQHPGPLTRIGKPLLPLPNVQDHLMEHVITGIRALLAIQAMASNVVVEFAQ